AVAEQVEVEMCPVSGVQLTYDLGRGDRHRPTPPEVDRQPVVGGELGISPPAPALERSVKRLVRAVEGPDHRRSERLGLEEAVPDAATDPRVLEVAGIAQEHPAGARRLAEVPGEAPDPEDLRGPAR